MISRKTTLAIANAYERNFKVRRNAIGGSRPGSEVNTEALYDFLYEHDYDAWVCNNVRRLQQPRNLKDWVLRFHTGETLENETPDWNWEQRQDLGQQYIRNLAEDFLQWYEAGADEYRKRLLLEKINTINRALELDGYVFREGVLLVPESDVLNIEEEVGILEQLHKKLNLENRAAAFEFLRLSEEHYMSARWSDCISNTRKFLESVLQEIAVKHSNLHSDSSLSEQVFTRPVEVRKYLEQENLIERRERETIDKIYGLLSHTGSHPYIAESDQARLLRQLGLTVSQFAMLRFEGFTSGNS